MISFRSKRNQVTLEQGLIIKRYTDAGALTREAQALDHLGRAGLAVPALLGKEQNALILEYIAGTTYENLVQTMDTTKAEALAEWLIEYRKITGLLRGDANLRNFLWTGTTCVGIDFEDPPVSGQPEQVFGKIIAFAATYDPAFTPEKAAGVALMLKAFQKVGGDLPKIRSAYLAEILAMNSRRLAHFVEPNKAALFFDKSCGQQKSGGV